MDRFVKHTVWMWLLFIVGVTIGIVLMGKFFDLNIDMPTFLIEFFSFVMPCALAVFIWGLILGTNVPSTTKKSRICFSVLFTMASFSVFLIPLMYLVRAITALLAGIFSLFFLDNNVVSVMAIILSMAFAFIVTYFLLRYNVKNSSKMEKAKKKNNRKCNLK